MLTHKMKILLLFIFSQSLICHAQLYTADNGDGTFKNPVLYADYSDPDVIRVGDDYYLVASSFTCQPGIPVLHSKDLVNWRIINYVYDRLPLQRYDKPQHGQGSWAPSIRFHNNKYYVYFCTPEDGLFVGIANHPSKKWELTHVVDVEKWEDPCPFWDDDGNAYLVRGAVGAGPCYIHRLSPDGKRVLDNGVLVFQNPERQPTLEGFKFMEKKDGYYYIAAPAGGVATGWQSILRSKNIYGPYEDKVVLHQGKTTVNGPHQGGFVQTQKGEWWFMHFQDRDAYGRIIHLQPVTWKDGWPIPGTDPDGDGIGEPVMQHTKPNVGKNYPVMIPQTSDEFNESTLGLQWQWHAAPQKKWYALDPQSGKIKLFTISTSTDVGNIFYAGNLLLQKVMAPSFSATTKLQAHFTKPGEQAGLVMMGNTFRSICIQKNENGNSIAIYEGKRDLTKRRWFPQEKLVELPYTGDEVYFKVTFREDQTCLFAYSKDGVNFETVSSAFKAEKGMWIGAKPGIYAISANLVADEKNYAAFDWFKVE